MSKIPGGEFMDCAAIETEKLRKPNGDKVTRFETRAKSLVAVRQKVVELDDMRLPERLAAMESRLEATEEAVASLPFPFRAPS